MQVKVAGQGLSIGQSLTQHVEDRLQKNISKYFDRAIKAEVVFSKEAHLFRAHIHVNEGSGTGVMIRSRADADDIYAAFDAASDRVEKQLRRYKRKLQTQGTKKISEFSKKDIQNLTGKKRVIATSVAEELPEEDAPVIIVDKQHEIERMTVSEAVMRMDLEHLPAYVFINKANNTVDVVYYRHDGNISWIDSNIKAG